MKRFLTFAYGLGSYLLFLATFIFAIGFVGNFGVPKSLDSPGTGPWTTALMIDLGLLLLFAVQHSVMARPQFKSLLTRVVSPAAERSTYVLASNLALLLLFWQWRPLGGVVWDVQNPIGRTLLYGGFAFGWLLVLVASFGINHFDLFGLRQVWRHLLGQPPSGLPFKNSVALPSGPPSSLCRLVERFLVHPEDDRDPPVLRSGHVDLHSSGDPTGGTRPDKRASGVRDIPQAGVDVDAVVAPTSCRTKRIGGHPRGHWTSRMTSAHV